MPPLPSIRGSLTGRWEEVANQGRRGQSNVATVEGGKLTAMMQDGQLVLTDEKGGTSTVTIANVIQSTGVIHVVPF